MCFYHNHTIVLIILIFCMSVLGVPPHKSSENTLYVDAQAQGKQDGTSWQDAFTDLQTALALAKPDDHIHIAQGQYVPTTDVNDRQASFVLPAGITVSGGYLGVTGDHPPRHDPRRFPTILSGNIDHNPQKRNGNSRVVVSYQGHTGTTSLQGLTITDAFSRKKRGAGLECLGPGELRVTNCVFSNNHSSMGGGCYVGSQARVHFQRCLWQNNSALFNGGALTIKNNESKLMHCIFRNNTAGELGGATAFSGPGTHQLINCLFNANTAGSQGGAVWAISTSDQPEEKTLTIINCTFAHNSANSYVQATGSALLMNTLFDKANPTEANVTWLNTFVTQSPRWFVDPNGPDNQAGTHDDDLRLSSQSPAIDAGSSNWKRLLPTHDLDSSPRILQDQIDVGAYEYWDALFVDDDAAGDPGPFDPHISDPFENGAINHPFDTIKEAFKAAKQRQQPAPPSSNHRQIVVAPGLYAALHEEDILNFDGHNIRLTSRQPQDITTIKKTILGYTLEFKGTEDPRCELAGFTIQHPKFNGIYGNGTQATIRNCRIVNNRTCDGSVLSRFAGTLQHCLIAGNMNTNHCGQRPILYDIMGTIANCTIADNHFGIHLATGRIENTILWGNQEIQLSINGDRPIEIRYSNIGGGKESIISWTHTQTTNANLYWGPGNMDKNPCFARHSYWSKKGPNEIFLLGDYHLQSQGWRYLNTPQARFAWTFDQKTSPCIDAGDPAADWSKEPASLPMDPDNQFGFNQGLNLGVYGNTSQASLLPTEKERNTAPITKELYPSQMSLSACSRGMASIDSIFSSMTRTESYRSGIKADNP